MGSQLRTELVWVSVIGAMIVATLALAGCPRPGGEEQRAAQPGGKTGGSDTAQAARGGAAQPSAEEVRRLLGNAPISDLAYRVYLGEGRAALDELGFTPDREVRYNSRLELGELGVFAPRTVDQLGGGTAYIQSDPAQDGCLAFAPDGGPVIWVHASAAWLEQRLPENTDPEYIYGGGSLSEQFRFYSHEQHQQSGEALGGQGLKGWFQLVLDAKAVTLRLSERDSLAEPPSADRLDCFLGPGRTAELQGR